MKNWMHRFELQITFVTDYEKNKNKADIWETIISNFLYSCFIVTPFFFLFWKKMNEMLKTFKRCEVWEWTNISIEFPVYKENEWNVENI